MKIVLFGSTDFTLSVANFLYENSYEISAVVTVPEVFKISYRLNGVKNSRFIDMHAWGTERNIPVITYDNTNQIIGELKSVEFNPNFAIVVGWYHMVPKKVRDLFPEGCAGFHASLLPKLRGGAPLNWAILLGLKETGVSFFELADGVDDGLLYAQEKFTIGPHDCIANLVQKSEAAIIKMLHVTLPKIKMGQQLKYHQEGVPSYCGQRVPEDSQIDWKQSAADILQLIRASSKPYTGAYSFLEGAKIIIWEAQIAETEVYGTPGQIMVINGNIYVVCGMDALFLKDFENKQLLASVNHRKMHWHVNSPTNNFLFKEIISKEKS